MRQDPVATQWRDRVPTNFGNSRAGLQENHLPASAPPSAIRFPPPSVDPTPTTRFSRPTIRMSLGSTQAGRNPKCKNGIARRHAAHRSLRARPGIIRAPPALHPKSSSLQAVPTRAPDPPQISAAPTATPNPYKRHRKTPTEPRWSSPPDAHPPPPPPEILSPTPSNVALTSAPKSCMQIGILSSNLQGLFHEARFFARSRQSHLHRQGLASASPPPLRCASANTSATPSSTCTTIRRRP